MKLKNKKLILFDLDGTLVDSVPDLLRGINGMLSELGRDGFSQDDIRGWVGNGALVLVKRALSGSSTVDDGIDEALSAKALDIFLKHYAQNLSVDSRLYPNVKGTLLSLKDRGYRLAIVTNKPYRFVEPLLSGFGINRLFDISVGGDSLSIKKPDPMMLEYVCKKLDIDIDNTVIVGDSKNDIFPANQIGMQSIGVTYGYNYDEDISVYSPSYVVDDFGDILALLPDRR
ncbi:MAG: phosphoglycolate phosphatase [Campylobacterota bacterium]|nr:phosphoglycolate phosphatase [Campylobacterota bacterium]